jgi:hypothetical protein
MVIPSKIEKQVRTNEDRLSGRTGVLAFRRQIKAGSAMALPFILKTPHIVLQSYFL